MYVYSTCLASKPGSSAIIITLTFEPYRSYGGRRPGRFSQICARDTQHDRHNDAILQLGMLLNVTSHASASASSITFAAEAPSSCIKTALRYIAELIGPLFALLTPTDTQQPNRVCHRGKYQWHRLTVHVVSSSPGYVGK